MESIIEDTISDAEISKAHKTYEDSKSQGENVEIQAKFQYAYCLSKSKHTDQVKEGIKMLESLYYRGEQNARRDYLYYIAIGHTRLRQYQLALDCVEHFLKYEPENRQAHELKKYIRNKLTKEGVIGMAIAGGAVLAVGGLLGMLMSRK